MKEYIEKANILMESLPYIKKFYGRTMVIKYGGSAMVDVKLKETMVLDIILMKYVGINPVVVHGGGKQITDIMKKLGKESIFLDGLRVTDKETMEITEMVLAGLINKEIVALINKFGGNAVGLCGKDAKLIEAKKITHTNDYGFVGEIVQINPQILEKLDEAGFIPIIAPIGIGSAGETYNINADTVAGRLAIALKAVKLLFLTDVRGICYLPDDESTFIPSIKINEIKKLINDKVITGGMKPKVDACISALQNGVEKTHIIDGRILHSILLEVFTEAGVGTEITL